MTIEVNQTNHLAKNYSQYQGIDNQIACSSMDTDYISHSHCYHNKGRDQILHSFYSFLAHSNRYTSFHRSVDKN